MMLLRGKGQGLEIGCRDRDLSIVCADLRARLAAQPDFYRGSRARATFDSVLPTESQLEPLRALLGEYGIALDDVVLEAPPEESAARRVAGDEPKPLSDSARSLVADFAGARADLAQRRIAKARSPPARPRGSIASAGVAIPPTPAYAPAGVSTLYHRGTLRGGQALHNLGNIVVVGDVNPGAELIASGDIVVVRRAARRRARRRAGRPRRRASSRSSSRRPSCASRPSSAPTQGMRRAPGRSKRRSQDDRIVVAPLDQRQHVHREVSA